LACAHMCCFTRRLLAMAVQNADALTPERIHHAAQTLYRRSVLRLRKTPTAGAGAPAADHGARVADVGDDDLVAPHQRDGRGRARVALLALSACCAQAARRML